MAASSRLPTKGGHYKLWRRAGGLVYVAGQVPRDADRQVIGSTVEEQTAAAIHNLRLVLQDAGCDLGHLVRVQAYLADIGDFARFNAAYAQHMGTASPVRTTIGCALNGVLVELDGVADPEAEVQP